MNVLITGVCGFIGSHLARKLLDKGWSVFGVDNLSYGSRENIADIADLEKFQFKELDITQPDFVDEFEHLELNKIVHLACVKTPRYGNRMEVLETNALGTENALKIAKAQSAQFIYGSSGELYGKNPEIPFTEESGFRLGRSSIKRWSSPVSQMLAEHLCFCYGDSFGLDFTIVRYFNVFGPGQGTDWRGGPQAAFIQAALENQPMEIHGDGVQTRDFTYIDDAIDALELILESPHVSNEIINIGNEKKISIINLAYMIWRLSENKNKAKLKFVAYSDLADAYEDIRHRSCDVTKAQCLLGYRPRTTLEDGLLKTLDWRREKTSPSR